MKYRKMWFMTVTRSLSSMSLSGPKITQVRLNRKFYKRNINKFFPTKVQEKHQDRRVPTTRSCTTSTDRSPWISRKAAMVWVSKTQIWEAMFLSFNRHTVEAQTNRLSSKVSLTQTWTLTTIQNNMGVWISKKRSTRILLARFQIVVVLLIVRLTSFLNSQIMMVILVEYWIRVVQIIIFL